MTTPDYSLYLVTDSGLLPDGRSLVEQVEAAIDGGVTMVQLREKTLATNKFIQLGRELHEVTSRRKVPLLINDRVDVALAVGCEGVHIGWDDCDYATARRLLGHEKLIGISVSNEEQARQAAEAEPDYIGVGPVFATATKPNHNPPIGPSGLRSLLEYIHTLGDWGRDVPAVCIGGINPKNVEEVCKEAKTLKPLSGVAVVSAIMAAPAPKLVCRQFHQLLSFNKMRAESPPPDYTPSVAKKTLQPNATKPELHALFAEIFANVRETKPMVHHITNNVVKNFSANICLAVGASPIMSEEIEETAELAAINGALVLNMGTATAAARPLFLEAIRTNNKHSNPIVFDPVGAGATALRRTTARLVLEAGHIDVIKGNEGEIRTLFGEAVSMRGVDSLDTSDAPLAKAVIVRDLARRHNNIVVMTGPTDFVSDGILTYALTDGSRSQALVTGTGCSLGTVIAAAVAANRDAKLAAVLAAINVYNYAARCATDRPGSWVAQFVDTLWSLTSNGEMAGDEILRAGYPKMERLEFE
ncbi:Hydroxyethylthiazole kinase family-domain-containing protein [Geopyxis carbonaria]|nr:Hydroxyethylthiazole kinase family-domain-containing protein [Geopyxis carbonaria]